MMTDSSHTYKRLITTCLLTLLGCTTQAQVKFAPDTLECHIVSFSVGVIAPIYGSNSEGLTGGTMGDLYKPPYLDFAIDWQYKFADRWVVGLDADLWFGSDNLQGRQERMPGYFSASGVLLGWSGADSEMRLFNRALALRPGVGYIVPIFKNNPNSGLLIKASAGWFCERTIFNQSYQQTPVPQLAGDYTKLYDQMRSGIMLSQSIGLLYMNNYLTYVNVRLAFELSECLSWSGRSYQLDEVMGLHGKDASTHFDLLGGVKLTWMFPFTGKTSYDLYYY